MELNFNKHTKGQILSISGLFYVIALIWFILRRKRKPMKANYKNHETLIKELRRTFPIYI